VAARRQAAETVLDAVHQLAARQAGQARQQAVEPELGAVLADEVEHKAALLSRRQAQAAADLLLEQHRALRVPQQQTRKLTLGSQTVELRHAPSWQLLYSGQAAGDVIRSLAWVGPSGSEAALGQLKRKLPAPELLAVANARARIPTWLASQVSTLVTRA